MNKQFIFIFSILTTLSLPLSGNAAIYKHVDEHGKITYSNVKIKGGKKVYIEPADTSFGTNSPKERAETGSKEAAPTNFPTQKHLKKLMVGLGGTLLNIRKR